MRQPTWVRSVRRIAALLPRAEVLLLLAGLVGTIWGKWVVLRSQQLPRPLVELLSVVLPDVLFFGAVFLLIRCIYLLKPSAAAARCALVIAALVLVWALLNAAWLVHSGVQIQPGILKLFIRDAAQLWPLAWAHVAARWVPVAALSIVVLLGLGLCGWALVRPPKVVRSRRRHVWPAAATAAVCLLIFGARLVCPLTQAGSEAATLAFSSHQYALVSVLAGTFNSGAPPQQSRHIPSAGQRLVGVPPTTAGPFPNLVMVVMESIPRSVTSLDGKNPGRTPCLTRLAREGADFRRTRILVTHTTKGLWSILTSTTPAIEDNYVEAVLTDEPYEGLPSLLGRIGYRSAYFQVAKGCFECAPGMASNLDFDWAWFRENLQDPSAHLGYLGADDCRMIEPAFQWATRNAGPFFLMMVTSVSHDPYAVPDWFGPPKDTPEKRYHDSIRYTDHFLERVCEAMKARGLYDNTILCIVGDHGVSFRPGAGKAWGRWWPYEEVIHVPWVLWWPGHVQPGRRIDEPCSHLDIAPTILKLIGFDLAAAGLEGRDALGASSGDRRQHFSSWYPESPMGYVEGNRKVVYMPYLDQAVEYDLAADPRELHGKPVPPEEMDAVRDELLGWQRRSCIDFKPRRFRERFLYSHWQTFCAGRSAWAYFVP